MYLYYFSNYYLFLFSGITESLWHIKDAGIETIWLSPIYKSPMYDFGYDIADFKEIQPEYGTMQDFENLIREANNIGMYDYKLYF